MRSAVVSAVVLLLVLVHVQDSVAPGVRNTCLSKYPAHPCKGGWLHTTGNKCVKFFRLRKTFWEAQSYCSVQKGHLASIHSEDENMRVLCATVHSHKSSPTTNDYVWIGGKSSDPVGFTNWHAKQPINQAGHTCVVMNYNKWGEWAKIDCNKKQNFVCAR